MEKTNMVRYSKVFACSLLGVCIVFSLMGAGSAINGVSYEAKLRRDVEAKYQGIIAADVEAAVRAKEASDAQEASNKAKATKASLEKEKEAILYPPTNENTNAQTEEGPKE